MTNLDYITSEIRGDDTEKKKHLRKGALIAIAVVSFLYIFLNLVMVSYGGMGLYSDIIDTIFLALN